MCDECRNWKPDRREDLKVKNFLDIYSNVREVFFDPKFICSNCHCVIRQKRYIIIIKSVWSCLIVLFGTNVWLFVGKIINNYLLPERYQHTLYFHLLSLILLIIIEIVFYYILCYLGLMLIERIVDKHYTKTYKWVDAPPEQNSDIQS